MEKSGTKIFVVDDELKSNHPLIVKLGQFFSEVRLFKKSSDAIAQVEAFSRHFVKVYGEGENEKE